jgi:hypothetical protein
VGWIERGQGWMIGFKSLSAYCIFACSWLHKTSRAFQALPKDVKIPTPRNSDVTINMKVETSCCCLIHLLAITSAHFSLSIPIVNRANKESVWEESPVDRLKSRFEKQSLNGSSDTIQSM